MPKVLHLVREFAAPNQALQRTRLPMIDLACFEEPVRKFIHEAVNCAEKEFPRNTVWMVGLQISPIDGIVTVAIHTGDAPAPRLPVIPEYTHNNFRWIGITEWSDNYWEGTQQVKSAAGEMVDTSRGDYPYVREFVAWGAQLLNRCASAETWPFPDALLAAEAVGMDPSVIWKRGDFPAKIE